MLGGALNLIYVVSAGKRNVVDSRYESAHLSVPAAGVSPGNVDVPGRQRSRTLIPAFSSPPSLPPQPGSCAGLFALSVPACPCPCFWVDLSSSVPRCSTLSASTVGSRGNVTPAMAGTEYGVSMNLWSSMSAAGHSWCSQSSVFGKLRSRGLHSPKGAVLEGQPLVSLQTCHDKALRNAWQGHTVRQCQGLISANKLQQFLP